MQMILGRHGGAEQFRDDGRKDHARTRLHRISVESMFAARVPLLDSGEAETVRLHSDTRFGSGERVTCE